MTSTRRSRQSAVHAPTAADTDLLPGLERDSFGQPALGWETDPDFPGVLVNTLPYA